MLLGKINHLSTTSRLDVLPCRQYGMYFSTIYLTPLSIPALYISSYVFIFIFNSFLVCEDIYLQTMQRVSNSWRSTMGSTVIAIILAFCNGNAELKNSDDNRQEFAAEYLDNLRFLYHKSEGDDTAVKGAVKICGLGDSLPYGALAIATAAVSITITIRYHIHIKCRLNRL